MGRNFKDLVAWQRADDLAVAIYRCTREFPPAETYGLRSQIRRAAVSVGANIAEGSGKRTPRERRACYDDSMGELNEIETDFCGGAACSNRPERRGERENACLLLGRFAGRLRPRPWSPPSAH